MRRTSYLPHELGVLVDSSVVHVSEPKPLIAGVKAMNPTCIKCNWGEAALNLGGPNESVWLCHGCIKRMYDELQKVKSELAEWKKNHGRWLNSVPYYPELDSEADSGGDNG